MPKPTGHDDRVNRAVDLARDTAPDIDVVLITHYPDAETLDTLRPGETDLQTVHAANRAVAQEMWDAGVEVLVQRADRAAFRRWMADREDTPESRRAWIDRSRLLRGAAALEALGLKLSAPPPPQTFGKGAGTDRGPAAGGVRRRRGRWRVRRSGPGAHGRWADRRPGSRTPQMPGTRGRGGRR